MKTDTLLRQALLLARMHRRFSCTGATTNPVHPAGAHRCPLLLRRRATGAELRFAASELGVARVEMNLLLPGADDDGDPVALYERVSSLCARGYPCHFSRRQDTRHVQVRAQVFLHEPIDEEYRGIPVAADAIELSCWIRTSYAASLDLVRAYVGKVS